MTSIAKIDAHHHLWTLGTDRYPILSGPPSDRYFGNTAGLRREFGPPEFVALAAASNVVKSVYVESMYSPSSEEPSQVQAWSDAYGFPHAFIARADLTSPALASELDSFTRRRGFRGLRMTVSWDQDPMFRSVADPMLMHDAVWRSGYAELGRRGLIAEVMALPAQLRDLAEVAALAPATTLVLNHTGMPLQRTPADREAWREGLRALARLPNTFIKISGLGMIDHAWTPERIRPLVDETIAIFGARRCMFASNYPVDGLHAAYADIWEAFDLITSARGEEARAALFHDNAERIYRLS